MGPLGVPVNEAPPEGDWILRFYSDPLGVPTLVRTETISIRPLGPFGVPITFNYLNATLVSDMGEQTFRVDLTEIENGFESTPITQLLVELLP